MQINEIEFVHDNQLELGLPSRRGRHAARNRRVQRANWWFARMRRVVDTALDWQATPPARPEQEYLTLASRRN